MPIPTVDVTCLSRYKKVLYKLNISLFTTPIRKLFLKETLTILTKMDPF
jgi:hypothetical protein